MINIWLISIDKVGDYLKIEQPKYLMLNGKNAFPNVTYENFLIDILNSSQFFRSKCSFMERYILVDEQSNGENDAYTSDYQVDFKLLIGDNIMRARYKNAPDVDYSQTSKGFIFTKTREVQEEVPDETILLDISKCKIEDLCKGQYANNTIKSVVKNIKKPKNLFMYYPYEFIDVNEVEYKIFITEVLKTFDNLLQFRDELDLGKDTFLCLKINKDFVIYEWYERKLLLRDTVNELLIANYRGLKTYSVY